jgi:hypothetical protein
MSDFKCAITYNSIIESKERLIILGDLHADYKSTITLFKKLDLIIINNNNKPIWNAKPKNTVIVQLGDQVDGGGRGTSESSGELDLIEFMENIHVQAYRVGGGVYSLIGNHEIMNLLGDFRYASSKDINIQGGEKLRKELFKPGGDLFNNLSCTRNAILQIGNFVFAHAGIVPDNIKDFDRPEIFIKYINLLMKEFLQGKRDKNDEEIQKYFLDKDTSIIWNRQYGNEITKCSDVEDVVKMLNVGHMIVGHTIQNKINSTCNNKLWRVDVGISKIFNSNNLSVLEILDNGIVLPKNNFKPFRILI